MFYSHSTPPSNAIGPSSQTASSVMESVAGVTDWNFLRTGGEEEEETSRTTMMGQERARSRLGDGRAVGRRPTLEDFDGEIAVFQVQKNSYTILYRHHFLKSCNCMFTTAN